MKLHCPSCDGQNIQNNVLDWYGDYVFGKFHCKNCGCTFAAKYALAGIVNGSIRVENAKPKCSLPSQMNLGGQMVRLMFQGHS